MRHHEHSRRLRWGRIVGVLMIAAVAVGFAGALALHKRPSPVAQSQAAVSVSKVKPPVVKKAAPVLTPVGRQLKAALAPLGFTGTAIVVKNGKTVGTYTAGWANLAAKRPISANTMYEIDSVQKVMTAVLVMRQIRAKKLSFDTKLSKFYPKAPNANFITVRQLLDMTSGLTYKPDFKSAKYKNDWQVAQHAAAGVVATAGGPGNWFYSGANYTLLSGMLVKLTGKTYRQLLTSTILKPLALTHTRFAYLKPVPDMAVGYHWVAQSQTIGQPFKTNLNTKHMELGTGQLFMSPGDLYRVEAAIQTNRFLTPAEKAQLFTPGSVSSYGGGLYHRVFDAANGYGYGFQTHMRISSNGKDALIVMANANFSKPLAAVVGQLTQQYLP